MQQNERIELIKAAALLTVAHCQNKCWTNLETTLNNFEKIYDYLQLKLKAENDRYWDMYNQFKNEIHIIEDNYKRSQEDLRRLDFKYKQLKAQLQNRDNNSQVEHCEVSGAKLDDKPKCKTCNDTHKIDATSDKQKGEIRFTTVCPDCNPERKPQKYYTTFPEPPKNLTVLDEIEKIYSKLEKIEKWIADYEKLTSAQQNMHIGLGG